MKDKNGNPQTDLMGKKWWIDDFLRQNFDFIRPRVSHKIPHRRSDMFIIVDGPVGSGKTTLSFQCARYFDPTFCLERVVFSVDDFLRVLIAAEPGQAVVFDEAIIVNSRSALTDFNKKVIIAMTQIRSKGLYIFFNIPSVFDLDRNLVLNRCHLLLHCYQDRFGDRGKFCVFDHEKMKMLYLKGKKLYTYAFPKANFVAKFTEFFYLHRTNYENKKQREIAAQATGKKSDRYKIRFLKLFKWMNKNWKQELLMEERCNIISEIVGDMTSMGLSELLYVKKEGEEDTEPKKVIDIDKPSHRRIYSMGSAPFKPKKYDDSEKISSE